MRTNLMTIALVLLCVVEGFAQRGSAPDGYYPPSYGGSTFTGEVTAIDVQHQTLTLTYSGKKKSETFVGRLQGPCEISGKAGTKKMITVTNFVPGTVLTAFFNENSKKVDGTKVKENVIIAITVSKFHGQTIDPSERALVYCSDHK